MPVLVYSPQIQVLVECNSGTFDISNDISSGSVTLRENSYHSMSLNLVNKSRRYDRKFSPNDRFVIYMTRLKKLLVMTGYLDSVPYYSAWERTVQISGTSTIKRLLYHYWDPGTPAAFALMQQFQGSGAPGDGSTASATQATALLTQVGGWNADQIHIAALPTNWISGITTLYNTIAPTFANGAWDTLGGNATISGGNPLTAGLTVPHNVNAPPGGELPTTFPTVVPVDSNKEIQNPTASIKNGQPYYCEMQWGYRLASGAAVPGVNATAIKNFLAAQQIMVMNPNNNQAVVVQICGWGGPTSNSMGLSPQAITDLGLTGSDPMVSIQWVDPTLSKAKSLNIGSFNGSDSTNLAATVALGGVASTNPQSVSVSTNPGAATALAYCANIVSKNIPYHLGGGRPIDGTVKTSYDCSSLVANSWYAAGSTYMAKDTDTYTQWADLANIQPVTTVAQLQPGDLIYYNYPDDGSAPNHVVMFAGGNQVYAAPKTGDNVVLQTMDTSHIYGYRRPSGGSGSASTVINSSGDTSGVGGSGGGVSGVDASSPLTIWDWYGQAPDPLSIMLTGARALMNDTPLLPMINTVLNASMRSWCSAPNGDFIAWFPDYFGVYGTAGIMQIADIEIQDFTMQWSDTNLVTHQFTAGSMAQSPNGSDPGGTVSFQNEITTQGIATIDYPQIIESLFNINAATDVSGFVNTTSLLNRFGARPNYAPMGILMGGLAEFWYAIYLFQQNWSQQFSANVPITFMPELYPGMLMQLPKYGFQAYVNSVTHTFDYSDGGSGFQTQASIIAPSSTGTNPGLYGLPLAGQGPSLI